MTTRRPPPRITASYLENAALHYLERYASSTTNLKRVLLRKVDRSIAHHGGEREEAEHMVAATLAKLAGLGYLDDGAYAEMKVRGLHRKGGSTRAIRATLAAKGVDADTVNGALSAMAETVGAGTVGDLDLAAAIRLAKRRRLGPFRPDGKREEFRTKDMAALGRAGFAWEIVRAVMETEETALLDG